MNIRSQRRLSVRYRRRTLLAAVTFTLATAAVPVRAASACGDEISSASVVTIAGRRLTPFLRRPVSDLRVWTYERGNKRPIPFQVDACDEKGQLLLPEPGRDLHDRGLEETDILLIWASDALARRPEPPPRNVIEIKLNAGDREDRWAYVGLADGSVGLSGRDRVIYDPKTDIVHADRYTVGFRQGYADYFSMTERGGERTENLIDRWKIRMEARFLWGLLRFRRNEEDISERVIGYLDGPIRVVRRSLLRTRVGWGISTPEAVSNEYFYGDHYGGPSYVQIPFKLSMVLGDVEVRIYLDGRTMDSFAVSAEGYGARVSSPNEVQAAGGPSVSWFALTDSDGYGLLHHLRLGPTLDEIKSDLLYTKTASPDPPEAVPGLSPGVGYRLTHWSTIARGQHEIWTETYVIDPGALGRPDLGLMKLTAPSTIEIHLPPHSGRPPAGIRTTP